MAGAEDSGGAAGAVGGGVGGFGLGQDGEEGVPLGLVGFGAAFFQRGDDQGGEIGAQGGCEAEELTLGQMFGREEEAVEVFDHQGPGAQALAARLVGVGVEGLGGGVERVEIAGIAQGDDDFGTLPRGQVLADVVFLNHRGEGIGKGGGGSDEGVDFGIRAAQLGDIGHGGQAAQAGDQGVGVGAFNRKHLYRHTQTVDRDGGLEFAQGVRVKLGAIARQGACVDLVDGEAVEHRISLRGGAEAAI